MISENTAAPISPQNNRSDDNVNPQEPIVNSSIRESELFPGQYVPLPEETVLEWQAPSRPFKKRDRQYYTTIIAIVFLVSLILFFAGQFLPIAVVISIGFLAYVLSSVPPDVITNKITTYGVRIDNDLYYWEELGRFWFEPKYGYETLQIELNRFPGRIVLLLGDLNKDDLGDILSEVLLNQTPPATFMDKASAWLQKNIRLEK